MFITKKKHEQKMQELRDYYNDALNTLRKQLDRAESLQTILDKLFEKTQFDLGTGLIFCDSTGDMSVHIDEEKVPVYVEDVLGGKCIKQEATKVTTLDKDGNATYGYTKAAPDKGFSYLLRRHNSK